MFVTLAAVTLVLASAGEDVTVFAADDETVATGGAVEVSGMVALAVGTVLGLVFDGVAFTVVKVVAVVGVDVVGFGEAVGGLVAVAETFWVSAGAEVTVVGVDVTVAEVDDIEDKAEACGKSFPAAVLAGTDFAVVVTAGVTLTIFDKAFVAVVTEVAGTDVETALTAKGDDETVDGVGAAGVEAAAVLAESGSVVFKVVETEGFGLTGALEAAGTTGVGFTLGGTDVTVLAGSNGVVVVGVAVTGIVADVETEDAEETWL